MDSPEADAALDRILQTLSEKRGLNSKDYRRTYIERRIEARFFAVGVQDILGYEKILPNRADEWDKLFDTLTINVSEFFRDPTIWEYFSRELLPPLFRLNRKARIWSAGCASGEEPYSIAILLHEAMRLTQQKAVFELVASDVDPLALQRARKAVYASSAMGQVSPQRIKIFFSKSGDNYEVNPPVRSMVQFHEHNYLTPPRYGTFDIISCRNSMIYLKTEAKEKALANFFQALQPGGTLILGATEVLLGEAQRTQFEPVASQPGIFKKKSAK